MQLHRNAHHVFRLMYHFVWIPKYRHKVFTEPYAEMLKHCLRKIGYDYNMPVVELEIPQDHLHMVVVSEPKWSPSRMMQIFKSISAREFFGRYPEVKRRYFWEGKLWTQRFFVETVGNYTEAAVRAYVQEQLQQMDAQEAASRQLGFFG
jgi:putative transposase